MNNLHEFVAPFGILIKSFKKLEGYGSLNFLIKDASGNQFIFKYYSDPKEKELVLAENSILESLSDYDEINIPNVYSIKKVSVHTYNDGSFSRLLSFIEGEFLGNASVTKELCSSFGKQTARFNKALKEITNPVIQSRIFEWDLKNCLLNKKKIAFIEKPTQAKLVHYFFDQFEHFVLPQLSSLRHQIIHNDLNEWNVLMENQSITGLFDFGDVAYAPLINEVAIALTYLMMGKENPIDLAEEYISAYHNENPLTQVEIELLYCLIPSRLATSVCNSAEAKTKNTDTDYILISEKSAWELLEKWLTYSPTNFTNRLLKACSYKIENQDVEKVKSQRQKFFSPALSLSYDLPIHMESAAFQYMYDVQGNTFLDAYNNIPLVGHCHPKISQVISKQVRRLNTNTRYHYNALGDYAEKLLSYFPSALNKIYFVNSGSAASDLAIRIAETYATKNDHLVLEHGYHGNTSRSIDVSSYKFSGKGGKGIAPHIIQLPLPKEYNGKYSTSEEYVENAKEIIRKHADRQIASFIAEPISGCGGQVPLIKDYLKNLQPFLEEQNILTIIDEVQTGFGRLGTHFWGFQYQGIEPDIVILGKPIGNGHPIGAVVTTSEIAQRFDNGMEFFSSFGGNPVSCLVGHQVLSILEEEELQKNARDVGSYWKTSLQKLAQSYPCMGDVRGQGLFLGIEIISPSDQKEDKQRAHQIKNEMRQRHILCSTDGPHDNVIKVKPPLCFTKDNVDHFVKTLEICLRLG